MHRITLALLPLYIMVAGCGGPPVDSKDDLLSEGDAGSHDDAADGEDPDDAQAIPTSSPNAEDDQPLTGLDPQSLLAMPLGTAPDRPCGLRRPIEKELLNRFGWDDEGRLVIFDYVFVSTDEYELESRNVLFYDDQGRLTDDVYVEGTMGYIDIHLWYEWDGDEPVFRHHNRPDTLSRPAIGTIVTAGDSWSDPDRRFEYDPSTQTLKVWDSPEVPTFIEYELSAPVAAADVVVSYGIFDSFRLMGPILSATEVYETVNDATGETRQRRDPIVYEHDENGRIAMVGEDELIYDCSMYD